MTIQIQKATDGYKIIKWYYGQSLEVPYTWKFVSLEFASKKLENGLTYKHDKNTRSGIPITRIETISSENVDKTKVGYIKPSRIELEKHALKKGDILLSHINSLKHVGKTAIYEGTPKLILHGMNLIRIVPDPGKIIPKFLFYYLRSALSRDRLRAISNRAINQVSINTTQLKRFKILVPPLKEQQKIVSILSNVDSLINQTQKEIELNKKLKKGLMNQLLTRGIGHKKFKKVKWLFGKEIEIPEEWEICNLGDICQITKLAGFEYTKHWKEDPNGEIIALRGFNIQENELDLTEVQKISKKLSDFLFRSKLFKDDVLFPFVGSIGKAALVNEDDKFHINQNVAKISKMEEIIPRFLVFYLLSNLGKIQIIMQNTSGTQPSVLLSNLRKFRVPLPPIEEQRRISLILSDIYSRINDLEYKKSKLESLKKGLMQKLLTGKIRVNVNWSNDC